MGNSRNIVKIPDDKRQVSLKEVIREDTVTGKRRRVIKSDFTVDGRNEFFCSECIDNAVPGSVDEEKLLLLLYIAELLRSCSFYCTRPDFNKFVSSDNGIIDFHYQMPYSENRY